MLCPHRAVLGHQEHRHRHPSGLHRDRPAFAGRACTHRARWPTARARSRSRQTRPRPHRSSSSRPSTISSPDASAWRGSSRAISPRTRQLLNVRTGEKERTGNILNVQGKESEGASKKPERATSWRLPNSRTLATGDTLDGSLPARPLPGPQVPSGGHLLRPHAEEQGRRGEGLQRTRAAVRRRPGHAAPLRAPDQRDDHLRHQPGARGGHP